MAADQAAGLRRRSTQQPLRCIHCFFDSPDASTRLAQALHHLGQVSLLVDLQGRVFANGSTRSLFNPTQQLDRDSLCILPQAYGAGWSASGIQGDEQHLRSAAQGFDWVMFDAGLSKTIVAPWPGAFHVVVIEIDAAHASMLRAYAVLKTLARTDVPMHIVLLGDHASCNLVRAACSHFLASSFVNSICNLSSEEDAFTVLAIRIAAGVSEERNMTARTTTGINRNHGR
jgi:hypothetical protein